MTQDQPPDPGARADPVGGRHRRWSPLLDRWYLVLAVAVLIASFPVLTAVLSDAGRDTVTPPVPPAPVTVAAPVASGSPSSGARPSVDPYAKRSTGSSAPGSGTPGQPATTTPRATTFTATRPASLTITATRPLFRGDTAGTDRTTLRMGTDGDLVITDAAGTRLWHANTAPGGYQATFQDDGNFAVYTQDQRPLWTSGTAGHPGAVLVLRSNGDVCILAGTTALWCAGTAR